MVACDKKYGPVMVAVFAIMIGFGFGFLGGHYSTDCEEGSNDSGSIDFSTVTSDVEEDDVPFDGNFTNSLLYATVENNVIGSNCIVLSSSSGGTCTQGDISGLSMNTKGIDLVTQFEGWEPTIYVDAVGIETIGYGHNCEALGCSGSPYDKGYITVEEGRQILAQDLVTFENCIKSKVTVDLNENQFSALVSFTFNVGCGNLGSSTLLSQLNQGQYSTVPEQMARWKYGNGQVLPGLVRRREAEGNLWENTDCSSSNLEDSSLTGTCKLTSACLSGQAISNACPGNGDSSDDLVCCVNEAEAYDSCIADDQSGWCYDESECNGITYTGKCPGPANIKCCVAAYVEPPPDEFESCTVSTSGDSGYCKNTGDCDGTSYAGYCPGAADIQCCIAPAAITFTSVESSATVCSVDGDTGECVSTSTCTGTSHAGYCPGAADIQCCIPNDPSPTTTCVVSGQQGACVSTTTCDGTSHPGYCPGAADIQCCIPDSPYGSCQAYGLTGACISESLCFGSVTAGLCPGDSTIKCCTSNSDESSASACGLGAVTMYDAYKSGTWLGKLGIVTLQGKKVEQNTACSFLKMEAAYGSSIRINSGFRTMAEQEYLYDCYITGSCNNGNLAARPGYSNHQNGIAMDLSMGSTGSAIYQWMKANAETYGFVRTVQSEIWHWEYRPGTPAAWYT